MIVHFRGCQSTTKHLSGGGPQGTLIALLLFLVLVNDLGFEGQTNNAGNLATCKNKIKLANEIHLKFIDDLTIAESVDMSKDVILNPNDSSLPRPTDFHSRTGHYLPESKSKVFKQLGETVSYAEKNEMKINFDKTKLMLFNTCNSVDFIPNFTMQGKELEVVHNTKLLGLHIRSDLKWKTNTHHMVVKANKKLWILRRLKILGAKAPSLVDVYLKQIRSILEFGVPVWNSSITVQEKADIERVQKNALRIILGRQYSSYENALVNLNLERLESRRTRLCLNFAIKASSHPKFKHWFKENKKPYNMRRHPKFKEVHSNHARFTKSPLGYLTKLLNSKS